MDRFIVFSACIPFDTPVSACLAMKTLLCGREVARQLLALQLRSNDNSDDEAIVKNNLSLSASTLESLYDSAEILLHSEIAIDRSSLVKVAIQVQLNCCRHAAVPQTFFQKSVQVFSSLTDYYFYLSLKLIGCLI